ncbi:MAG: glycerophosphodiester phosphodiesterase [Deltaproteobacteria bacterium]|nr:MAG: glycerophosphodiester phosphodiesterase [Deltaproteobacteria bacterium]
MKNDIFTIWQELLKIFRKSFGQIFAIHLSYIAFGVILFTPLAGIVGQFLLGLSGQSVLSDLDIAYFFVTPTGMVVVILFVSLMISILVFEQASLMAVCLAAFQDKNVKIMSTLYFTVRRAKNIFLFALHLVMRVLLITLPFLAISGAVAWFLVTDYDINYYLAAKPPVFIVAATAIGFLLLFMIVLLIRKLLAWSFALPLVLFGKVSPAQAFGRSKELTQGHKQVLLFTFGIWALAAFLLSTVVLGTIQFLGSALVPLFLDSITWLVPVLGGLVTLWTLINVLLTTVSSGSFAIVLTAVYIRSETNISTSDFTTLKQHRKKQMTLRLFLLMLIAGTAAAVIVGNTLLDGVQADEDIMILAHRGAAGKAPENTIASIRQAIKDGTDWIEIDVQESRDGAVVVIHDSDFMKLAGVNMKVGDGSLKQIQKIDVGSWFAPEFFNERVPTLAEVLKEARGKSHVLIELKYYGYDQQLEQRVVDVVERLDMVDEVAIMSLKYDGIKKFRALRPDWSVGLLSSKAIGKLSDLNVDFIAINMATAKPGLIRRIHKAGKQVFVWTVNDQVSMLRMISFGVDGLITDEPALAVDVLQEYSEFTPVERLLIHTTVLLNKPIPKRIYRDQSP